MATLDTRIAMMGQAPNITGNMLAGTRAAMQQNALMQDKQLRDVYAQRGAGIMQGNQNALAALAAVNPMQAQSIQASQASTAISQERLAMARSEIARQLAAEKDKKAAIQEAQENLALAQEAAALYGNNPERYAEVTSQITGGTPFPMNEMGLALLDSVSGGATDFLGAMPKAPKASDRFKTVGGQLIDLHAEGGPAPVPGIDGRTRGLEIAMPDGTIIATQGGLSDFSRPLPTDPDKLGTEISKDDADLLKAAQDQAAAADSLNLQLSRAETLLPNIDTGLGAPVKAAASKVGGALGLTDGSAASTYEELQSVSKTIGIDTLKAVGGNDTERELLTAIQTTVSPTKEDIANAGILADQKAAIDTISEKPTLMSRWVSEFGSLANPNTNGVTWSQYWRNYQTQAFRQRAQAYRSELGAADYTQPKAIRLEKLEIDGFSIQEQ